jgi:hypothetical protein
MKKYKLEIQQDTDAMNPRTEFDCNIGQIIVTNNRHFSGDKQCSVSEMSDIVNNSDNSGVTIPIYAYVHGGIRLNTKPFNCPWDSGQAGFISLNRKQFLENMGYKRMSAKRLEEAKKQLLSELETYFQYIHGEIYGYIITDDEGEQVDSCWGFYGKEYCKKEGENEIKNLEFADKKRGGGQN